MATTLTSGKNSLTMATKSKADNNKITTDEEFNKIIETLKQEFKEKYSQNKLAKLIYSPS